MEAIFFSFSLSFFLSFFLHEMDEEAMVSIGALSNRQPSMKTLVAVDCTEDLT